MATRPWATPAEVKAYTTNPLVQNRTDQRLKVDIFRAEQYVMKRTNNDFSSFATIPEPVKLAVILLAEMYAAGASSDKNDGNYKSETFDDYSYTIIVMCHYADTTTCKKY